MDKSSLGDRMKTYEKVWDPEFPCLLPVVVRLDGRSFSKFTAGLNKPFDARFVTAMAEAARYTASKMQGCVIGYIQSDEVSLVLRNDQAIGSQPTFRNRQQKINSIAAALMTESFAIQKGRFCEQTTPAQFDCRSFVVPNLTEALNCLIWRQQDCVRNSIQGASYWEIIKSQNTTNPGEPLSTEMHFLSPEGPDCAAQLGKKQTAKLLHGRNTNEQQEILFKLTGINWNDYPDHLKRGSVVYRHTFKATIPPSTEPVVRREWRVTAAPTFTSEEGRAWMNDPDRLGEAEWLKSDSTSS